MPCAIEEYHVTRKAYDHPISLFKTYKAYNDEEARMCGSDSKGTRSIIEPSTSPPLFKQIYDLENKRIHNIECKGKGLEKHKQVWC